MDILHFPAHLGIAVDPDDVATVGGPGFSRHGHSASLPARVVAINSPACNSGSKAASFCASVRRRAPVATTHTALSFADTATGWPTLNPAERAIVAGIRTARLLPHRWTVSAAVIGLAGRMCINQYIHGRGFRRPGARQAPRCCPGMASSFQLMPGMFPVLYLSLTTHVAVPPPWWCRARRLLYALGKNSSRTFQTASMSSLWPSKTICRLRLSLRASR